MKRKSTLAAAVHGVARTDKRFRHEKAPSRVGSGATKGVLLRLPAELHRQLRQLALDEDTSLQALGVEALERILEARK